MTVVHIILILQAFLLKFDRVCIKYARQVTKPLEMQGCVEISNMGQSASRNGEEPGLSRVRHRIINKLKRSASLSDPTIHGTEQPARDAWAEQLALITSRVGYNQISQFYALSRMLREISMRVTVEFLANKDELTTEAINGGERVDTRLLCSSDDRNFGEFLSASRNHTLLVREIGMQLVHNREGAVTFFRAFRFDAARTPDVHDNKIPVMILGLVSGSINQRDSRSWLMLQIVRYYDPDDPVLETIPILVTQLSNRAVDISQLPRVLAGSDWGEEFETRVFRPEAFCPPKVHSCVLKRCNHLLYIVGFRGENTSLSKIVEEGESCPICLIDYVPGDLARELPFCNHWFHQACIDQWLTKSSNTCPICRGCGLA